MANLVEKLAAKQGATRANIWKGPKTRATKQATLCLQVVDSIYNLTDLLELTSTKVKCGYDSHHWPHSKRKERHSFFTDIKGKDSYQHVRDKCKGGLKGSEFCVTRLLTLFLI